MTVDFNTLPTVCPFPADVPWKELLGISVEGTDLKGKWYRAVPADFLACSLVSGS